MRGSPLLTAIRRKLRYFAKDSRGNVAIIFGIALVPMLGLVGAAIDYSRASMVQAQMQASIDATTLALSKQAASDTNTQLQTNALSIFQVNFKQPSAQNVSVSATYATSGGSSVAVTASASIPTTFLGIIGITSIPLTATSTAKWGMSRLRVALVLDNTGSMAQSGKITALQTATNNLLQQLNSAATTNGDVYVSIVPFVNAVNLNSANYSASWIDWTDWNNYNGTCSNWNYNTKSTCTGAGKTWTAANHNTWNGCVTDRGSPLSTGATGPSTSNYDQNVSPPVTGNAATLYPAFQAPSCPQAAMGISYNWSAMTTLVNNMNPGGSTDQPIGLVWGWQTLVGGGPFTAPAMDPNYTYTQVIILLTDGLNTQDRWYGDGSNTSTQVDYRMYDQSGNGTCANIKAAKITIYTIQVNTDGSPTSTLLQNCASDSSKFFLLTSSSEIVTTFNTIGTNLSNLYLAK